MNAPTGGGGSRPKRKSSGSAAAASAGDSGDESEGSLASKRRAPSLSPLDIIKRLPDASRAALVSAKHISATGAVIQPPKVLAEATYFVFCDGFESDAAAADSAILQLKRFHVIARSAPVAAIKEDEEEEEEEEEEEGESKSQEASKEPRRVWKLKKRSHEGGGGT